MVDDEIFGKTPAAKKKAAELFAKYGTFRDGFAKWKAEQENISDAAEPDACACGRLIVLYPADDMELDTEYCDRTTVIVRTQRERHDYDGKPYTPLTPIVTAKMECPAIRQKRLSTHIEKIKTEYKTMTGEPMEFSTFRQHLQPAAFALAKQFADNGGQSDAGHTKLVLSGTTGVGKTHLARAIYVDLIYQLKACVWISAVRLAETIRYSQSYKDESPEHREAIETVEKMRSCDCVFIDDLGSERRTESEIFKEQFQDLLDKMTGSLVITTNLKSADLYEIYQPKIYSRLVANATGCRIEGRDIRRTKQTPSGGLT